MDRSRTGVGEGTTANGRIAMSRGVLSVAWYRFRATFRRRRSGYLAIVLLIGLVGGLAMASLVAARRTESSYPTFLAGTNPSDLLVQPTTQVTCASGFVGQIARLPHVTRVGCALALTAETLNRRGGLGTVLLTQVELVASPDGLFSDQQDRVTITSGRPPDPVRADEIVVSPTAAALFGLQAGSHLRIGIDCSSPPPVPPPVSQCPVRDPTAHYRTVRLTVVGEGVFNSQVIQDDIDRGHTGFLLGTPALAREFGACCTNVTYDGLRLSGSSRDDTVVEREYSHLLATSSFTSGRVATNNSSRSTTARSSKRRHKELFGLRLSPWGSSGSSPPSPRSSSESRP
jgi:hypothetical protein